LKDELLNQVYETVMILKERLGEKWNSSLLHNWTLFNFKNAAADSKQALRYLKGQKFAQSIRFIKTLKFLGGQFSVFHESGTQTRKCLEIRTRTRTHRTHESSYVLNFGWP
jgi:hypothetical protein